MTEPANPPELLPCPICGNPGQLFKVEKTNFAACDRCWTRSLSHNAERATPLWSRRAEPTIALTEARAAGLADAIAEIEARAAAFEAEITAGTWGPDTETQARELRTMASLLRRKAQGTT